MRIRMSVLAAISVLAVVLLTAIVAPVSAQNVSVERVTYSCVADNGYGYPYAEVTIHFSDGGTRTVQAEACNDNAVRYAVGEVVGAREGDIAYLRLLSVIEREESFSSSPLTWVLANVPTFLAGGFLSVLLYFNAYVVRQQGVYIVERFGRYHRTQTAGLRGKIPLVERIAGKLSLRQQEQVIEVDTKTKDDVFMDIFPAVQYRIIEPEKAFYAMGDMRKQMTTYTENIVRSVVPSMTMNDVFEKKEELAERIERDLAPKLGEYGIKVVDVPIKDLGVPEEIENARNMKVTQQSLLEANRHKGEADKVLVIAAAQAQAERDRLHGEGIAAFRKAVAHGTRESMDEIKKAAPNLGDTEISALLLSTQYYDTLKEIGKGPGTRTIFLPSGPGAATDTFVQLQAALAGQPPRVSKSTNGKDAAEASAS